MPKSEHVAAESEHAKSLHQSDKTTKPAAHAVAKGAPGPKLLAVPAAPATATGSVPPSVVGPNPPDMPRSAPPFTPSTVPLRPSEAWASPPPRLKPLPAMALAATSSTSPLDIAAVKQAVDLVHKGRTDEATSVEGTISDPVARKLVEWVILRSDEADLDFPRYAAFIAANPSWPSISALRRRAEAALWQQQADPRSGHRVFPERSATHRQRTICAGARAARRGRPRRRASRGARRVAQGRLLRRPGGASA